MKAEFQSRCGFCDGTVYPGDEIVKEGGVWGHKDREVCDSYDTQRQEQRFEDYSFQGSMHYEVRGFYDGDY